MSRWLVYMNRNKSACCTCSCVLAAQRNVCYSAVLFSVEEKVNVSVSRDSCEEQQLGE